MSKCRKCFLLFLLLATAIAFFCEISVPLIIYLHISSIRDREAESMTPIVKAGNDSLVISYPIRQVIDDNIAIFICLAGVTMFLIGVFVMACRKVKIMIAVPHVRATSTLREQYLEKLKERKVIAEMERMRAQIPFPPPHVGLRYV